MIEDLEVSFLLRVQVERPTVQVHSKTAKNLLESKKSSLDNLANGSSMLCYLFFCLVELVLLLSSCHYSQFIRVYFENISSVMFLHSLGGSTLFLTCFNVMCQ